MMLGASQYVIVSGAGLQWSATSATSATRPVKGTELRQTHTQGKYFK